MINFHKYKLIYNVISDTLRAKSSNYDIPVDEGIRKFLDRLPNISDKEMYEKSLQREPRNAGLADIL